MPTEHTIYFDVGGHQLVGTLHLPDSPVPPVIIGCHGLLANRHSPKQISLASACNRNGVAYFRFDHRGCGDSQGEFSKVTTLSARCQDLYHAVIRMKNYSGIGPLIALFGSSFGGTVVLAYAAQYRSPALITYAAPINSATVNRSKIRNNEGKSPSDELLTDALTFDITRKMPFIRNILIVHSEGDETVPVAHANALYNLVGNPKKITVFKRGDHRMTDMAHQQQFTAQFMDWIKNNRR